MEYSSSTPFQNPSPTELESWTLNGRDLATFFQNKSIRPEWHAWPNDAYSESKDGAGYFEPDGDSINPVALTCSSLMEQSDGSVHWTRTLVLRNASQQPAADIEIRFDKIRPTNARVTVGGTGNYDKKSFSIPDSGGPWRLTATAFDLTDNSEN
jgi:hypothetical protein